MTGEGHYMVCIPITGYIEIDVYATSEQDAFDKAWERYNECGSEAGDVCWEATEHVTEGNLCHAALNDIEVGSFVPQEDAGE